MTVSVEVASVTVDVETDAEARSPPTELAGVRGGSFARFAGTTAGEADDDTKAAVLGATMAGETEGRATLATEGVPAGVMAVVDVVTGSECACATAWNCKAGCCV